MGGTERIVHSLIVELQALGHEVTLLAEDSSKPPPGVSFSGIGTYFHQERTRSLVWQHLVRFGRNYDVIHNHGRLIYHLPKLWSAVPKVHTFHFGELLVPQVRRLLRLRPRNFAFVPCGKWIEDKFRSLGGKWNAIHNGLPLESYRPSYSVKADAPLVSIGRMDPRKGAPQAIRVAKNTGRRLIIAGVIGDQPSEKHWFEEHVLKHCDGEQIKFIGPVGDRQKEELLSQAAALLLPIQGSEAFTVVMIEAIANGCPVIGYNQYCIPELVTDGLNGFLVSNEEEMVGAVNRLSTIDRRNCRAVFEQRFTSRTMALEYLALYGRLGAN